MKTKIIEFVLNANIKCFATYGKDGVNAVPVSSLKIVDGNIWLFDYYMNRTVENLKLDKRVSLVTWKGMQGYQIKGDASYYVDGSFYNKAVKIVSDEFGLDRLLKGVIVIDVERIFSVTPGDSSLLNLL